MSNWSPVGSNILVKRDETKTMTDGGIALPETVVSREAPTKGVALAVGPGKMDSTGTFRPTQVKEGDQVIFKHHYGQTVEIGEEEFHVIDEEHILLHFGQQQ